MNKLIVVVYEDEKIRNLIRNVLVGRFKDHKIVAFPNNNTAKEFLVKHSLVGIILEGKEPYRRIPTDDMLIFLRQNASIQNGSFIIVILKSELLLVEGDRYDFENYDEIYIPFDPEELLMRVNNHILRIEREFYQREMEENSKPDLMERGEGEK